MKNYFIIGILLITAGCGGFCVYDEPIPAVDNQFHPARIAHGLGGIDDATVTNSRQALLHNYAAGISVFECDINKTLDGHYVLIHDFEGALLQSFGVQPFIPTLAEFLALRSAAKYQNLTLDEILIWLSMHYEVSLILDCKNINTEEVLRYIAEKYPAVLRRQIIPQFYFPADVQFAEQYGVKYYIWSLYKKYFDDDEIICWVSGFTGNFAVSMQAKRAMTSRIPCRLSTLNIPTLAFTVNDPAEAARLTDNCVADFYSDMLL